MASSHPVNAAHGPRRSRAGSHAAAPQAQRQSSQPPLSPQTIRALTGRLRTFAHTARAGRRPGCATAQREAARERNPAIAAPDGDERKPPQWAAVEAHVGLNCAQCGVVGTAQAIGQLGRGLDPSATGGMTTGGRNDVVPNDPTPSTDRPLE